MSEVSDMAVPDQKASAPTRINPHVSSQHLPINNETQSWLHNRSRRLLRSRNKSLSVVCSQTEMVQRFFTVTLRTGEGFASQIRGHTSGAAEPAREGLHWVIFVPYEENGVYRTSSAGLFGPEDMDGVFIQFSA